MAINFQHARQFLQQFNFRQLFAEELNWAIPQGKPTHLDVDGDTYTANPIAEQGGMMVFEVQHARDGIIPGRAVQLKITRRITQTYAEHILIFVNVARTASLWLWVKRQDGRLKANDHWFYSAQPGDSLLQKLNGIAFAYEDLDAEGRATIGAVLDRVEAAFHAERVTKHFYERFEKEHAVFLKFIDGIPDEDMQKWYASVMLNRLMFIYFIQRKGFLENNQDYLRHKLEAGNYKRGFYRDFLCPLFFRGFALKETERTDADQKLLGRVPYLNGGIFQQHEIENHHDKTIEIPDEAFQKVFDFFDDWRWHLDDRPLRDDKEINPDVLGYIFEKYINRKQMGAYYTKDDITGYISRNTILPFLFDAVREKCKTAFEGEATVWNLLRDDPDRYIYNAIRHGAELPLPPEIEAGVKNVSKRTAWNKAAPAEHALPTETWREVVARRQRYSEIKSEIGNRQSKIDINVLITLNLDIIRFAQDVVENAEPDLLNAFYTELKKVKILDPTCGSGAFLFAALNILYPLYEACLFRMRVFVAEWQRVGDKSHRNYPKWFAAELKSVEDHPNQRYFILKTIILNNLYGVDIMKEATEICKLRLFLKLAAQVEPASDKPNYGIEPLPDIDFNIQAGNTLVGFATAKEAEDVLQHDLLAYKTVWPEIQRDAEDAANCYQQFKDQQTKHGGEVTAENKKVLSEKFRALEDKLNRYLAADYGKDPSKKKDYEAWLKSHQPVHWFIEFYGILNSGGFDVIIGNPPYVGVTKIGYKLRKTDYESLEGANLYSLVMERSLALMKKAGRFGMIVPVSLISGEGFVPVARLFFKLVNWASSFSNRPGKLFYGVEQRLTILLTKKEVGAAFSSEYQHWYEDERAILFQRLCYTTAQLIDGRSMPLKTGLDLSASIAAKIYRQHKTLNVFMGQGRHSCWFHDGPTYWIRALPFEPAGNSSARSNHYHRLTGADERAALTLTSLLASSTFYLHFKLTGNCRDLGTRDIYSFRLPHLPAPDLEQLAGLAQRFGVLLKKTAKSCTRKYPSGAIEYDEYYPAQSKPILDEIDRILAKHYGFTDEELDFIINYDIKYRMGLAEEGNE